MKALDSLRANRNLLFWLLHCSGWLVWGVTQQISAAFYEPNAGYGQLVIIASLCGLLLSLPLRYLYRRLWSRSPRALILGVFAACYPLALLWRLCINATAMITLVPPIEFKTRFEMFGGTLPALYLLLCWSALYFGGRYYDSLQQQREATLKSASLAQEAQLKMLRYQLNPHYLFNTLNAISTLILDNQNRVANQAVGRLAEFLRYTLDQDPMKSVTLRQELDAINLYLNSERLRFGERLRLEFGIEEPALDALVPSLLLQPLVENAVKYAVTPREDGGLIRIEGRVRGNSLELVVIDDGPGIADTRTLGDGRGVGLRNTRERLAVLCGDAHRFAAINAKPGLRVEIGLPYELPRGKAT